VNEWPCLLLDGDEDGRGYFTAVRESGSLPRTVVFWPDDWAIEHVVAWIAAADELTMLADLGTALDQTFADLHSLTNHERATYSRAKRGIK